MRPERRSPARRGGFTLLEVLMALAVVALALGAVTSATGSYVSNQVYLQERTLAHWVARNTLTEWRLAGQWPEVGPHEDTVTMAGREWAWEVQVIQTPDEDLRRLEVSVRPVEAEAPLASLVGFVHRWPQ